MSNKCYVVWKESMTALDCRTQLLHFIRWIQGIPGSSKKIQPPSIIPMGLQIEVSNRSILFRMWISCDVILEVVTAILYPWQIPPFILNGELRVNNNTRCFCPRRSRHLLDPPTNSLSLEIVIKKFPDSSSIKKN